MNWAQNIKQLREKMLITQTELAKKINVSFASVNRYENNQSEPTMKVKRELMKLFLQYNIVQGDFYDEK